MSQDDFQSIALYNHAGSKALVLPYPQVERSTSALVSQESFRRNPHLRGAVATNRAQSLRLKFPTSTGRLWVDLHQASVTSHQAFLDILMAQHERGYQYVCCADLNLRGEAAGTHFFQRVPEILQQQQPQQELACIQLANSDKIRFIRLPAAEHDGLSKTIHRYWSHHGVQRADKYGLEVYKLAGNPWYAAETSADKYYVDAHKLVLGILIHMDQQGWDRVVPFDCTTSPTNSGNAGSLLFFRDKHHHRPPPSIQGSDHRCDFCAISLEKQHKIRLIGGGASSDDVAQPIFENAVRRSWNITETHNLGNGNLQLKLSGRPWCPTSTAENIASAQLVCNVLQDLWKEGWRWHCAVDMSCKIDDKSTFFLRRSGSYGDDDDDIFANKDGRIACVQPKGKGKVNLVSFPASALQIALAMIRSATWSTTRLIKVETHGQECATIHFENQSLHYSSRTAEKISTASVYTTLLRLVASVNPETTMLGAADISGNFYSHRDSNGHTTSYSLDTDAFFLWLPTLS